SGYCTSESERDCQILVLNLRPKREQSDWLFRINHDTSKFLQKCGDKHYLLFRFGCGHPKVARHNSDCRVFEIGAGPEKCTEAATPNSVSYSAQNCLSYIKMCFLELKIG